MQVILEIVCLFVVFVKRPSNLSLSSFQTASRLAIRTLFYATLAVTASMR